MRITTSIACAFRQNSRVPLRLMTTPVPTKSEAARSSATTVHGEARSPVFGSTFLAVPFEVLLEELEAASLYATTWVENSLVAHSNLGPVPYAPNAALPSWQRSA